MTDRGKIEERLRRKEQEITSLEEQLKAARVYVQALQDVLKILPKAPNPTIAAESVLRPGSTVALAREAILSERKPLQILALLNALEKESTKENRSSLTGSLAAYVRKGEIFTRPAPNTFGLIELGHHTVQATEAGADDNGPPEGFGQVKLVDTPTAVHGGSNGPPPAPKASVPRAPPSYADDVDDDIPF